MSEFGFLANFALNGVNVVVVGINRGLVLGSTELFDLGRLEEFTQERLTFSDNGVR